MACFTVQLAEHRCYLNEVEVREVARGLLGLDEVDVRKVSRCLLHSSVGRAPMLLGHYYMAQF